MAYDLSFSAAEWAGFSSAQKGTTGSFGLQGIYFNQLRPIVNDSKFHRAIEYLWNATQFLGTYLGGIAGTVTPALFPCSSFATSCDTTYGSTWSYGSARNLVKAVQQLVSIKAPASLGGGEYIVPYHLVAGIPTAYSTAGCSQLTGDISTGAAPAACTTLTNSLKAALNYGTGVSSAWWCVKATSCTTASTKGFSPGNYFVPLWVYRNSLGRHYFSDWIVPNSARIGLLTAANLKGTGGIVYARAHVFGPSAAAVISDGIYTPTGTSATCAASYPKPGLVFSTTTSGAGACPGWNTKPVYNYSHTVYGAGIDDWDMYSFGYSASVNYVFFVDAQNSAFGASTINPTNLHNATMDKYSNPSIFASTGSAASAATVNVAKAQLRGLAMMVIYYTKTLFANYITGWAGWAFIPNYGTSGGPGLFYTGLNLYRTCWTSTTSTCAPSQISAPTLSNPPYSTTLNVGLDQIPDPNGGLNPLWPATTVYDNDVWGNIYDSPLNTPVAGFQAPLQFMSWMTTSFSTTSFTGSTPTGCATFKNFYFQKASHQTCAQGQISQAFNGNIYTFVFRNNVYFSDHVRADAYDFNYSLWQSGVTNPFLTVGLLPDLSTPFLGLLAGGSGLILSQISPDGLTLKAWINNHAVWNLLNLGVPVLPWHIFKYYNQDKFATDVTMLDTAKQPLAQCTFTRTGSCAVLPGWLKALPNLEIGTGPFILRTTDETLGSALLVNNPNFYRAFWQYYTYAPANQVIHGASFTIKTNVYEWTYNTTRCPLTDHKCKIPMTLSNLGVTGGANGGANVAGATLSSLCTLGCTWKIVDASGTTIPGFSGTLTCGLANGLCQSSSFSTAALPAAPYLAHVIVTVHYTYNGLARTWVQDLGFKLK
ncbi:MAG: hypothetical protein HY296_01280 [Thaumarchaeota archaeon]|nr:hypothetical protein [Nitrososphaerota archaeon]